MRKYFELLLSLCIIGWTGCTRYEKVEAKDVEEAFILNSSITFKGYFYQGSDASYHYFVSKWNPGRNRYFKLPFDRLAIDGRHSIGHGAGEIQVDLSGQENDLFGQNRFYKLYVVGNPR